MSKINCDKPELAPQLTLVTMQVKDLLRSNTAMQVANVRIRLRTAISVGSGIAVLITILIKLKVLG